MKSVHLCRYVGGGALRWQHFAHGARKRAPRAPNCAPSLCSVAGLLVAKWVPPTSTPSDFPLGFTENTLWLRRLPNDQRGSVLLARVSPPAVSGALRSSARPPRGGDQLARR